MLIRVGCVHVLYIPIWLFNSHSQMNPTAVEHEEGAFDTVYTTVTNEVRTPPLETLLTLASSVRWFVEIPTVLSPKDFLPLIVQGCVYIYSHI